MVGICTIATPNIKSAKAVHFRAERDRLNSNTLKSAVGSILNWYVTCNVAASRFEMAMYCRVFCSVNRLAGMASFQLSPVKTAPVRELSREVAGSAGERVLEIS